MSLIIEQKLVETEITENKPVIYTTGAYLIPMELKIGDLVKYIWVVDEFNDDTYICPTGKSCSPRVFAKSAEELLIF